MGANDHAKPKRSAALRGEGVPPTHPHLFVKSGGTHPLLHSSIRSLYSVRESGEITHEKYAKYLQRIVVIQ